MTAALRLAEAGCHVFPLKPGQKVPATTHGLKDATRDPEQIRAWWAKMPAANVGLSVGPSGLAVVDLDGFLGYAAWHKLTQAHGDVPTLTVRTPHGQHRYYLAGDRPLRNTASQLAPNVDTRGPGGYVVAPGSTVNGSTYSWLTVPTTLPVLPGWICDRLAPAPRRTMPALSTITAGSRYAEVALAGEVQAVLDAGPNTRNDYLNAASFNLGQLVGAGVLDELLAVAAITTAGETIGLTPREVAGTVRSGMTAGIAQPRQLRAAS